MLDDFVEWYRDAELTPDGQVLEARWRGVDALCAAAKRDDVVALLKCVCLPDSIDSLMPRDFRARFKAADPTFPAKGNDLEVRVLSGACLRALMDNGTEHARDTACLGLVCGAFGQAPANWVGQHVLAAEARAATLARARRNRRPFPTVTRPTFDRTRFLEANQAHFNGNALTGLKDSLLDALADLSKTETSNAVTIEWL